MAVPRVKAVDRKERILRIPPLPGVDGLVSELKVKTPRRSQVSAVLVREENPPRRKTREAFQNVPALLEHRVLRISAKRRQKLRIFDLLLPGHPPLAVQRRERVVVDKVRQTPDGSVHVAGRKLRVSKGLEAVVGEVLIDSFREVLLLKQQGLPRQIREAISDGGLGDLEAPGDGVVTHAIHGEFKDVGENSWNLFSEVDGKCVGRKLGPTFLANVALIFKRWSLGEGPTIFYVKFLICSKMKQARRIWAIGRDQLNLISFNVHKTREKQERGRSRLNLRDRNNRS